MMLGKRARHPMKRTTSMTEFSFDDLTIHVHPPASAAQEEQAASTYSLDHHHSLPVEYNYNQRVTAMVSPRVMHRRNSADFTLSSSPTTTKTCSFLTTCSLCRRRLAPGRDIFMYRGDSGFCSLECRQQQMTQDEWKEKEKQKLSSKESNSSTSTSTSTSTSSTAGSVYVSSPVNAAGEMVAAL